MKRWLLALALLASPALADEIVETTVHTYPPNLAMYRQFLPKEPQVDTYLGRTGVPLELKVESRTQSWNIYFVYLRPGESEHPVDKPVTFTVTPNDISGRYPAEGTLSPVLPEADLRDYFLRTKGPWLGAGALLGLVLLAALIRSRGQVSRLNRKVERMIVPPDPGDPLVGRRFSSWVLANRLGQGGMASVYRGLPVSTMDVSEAVAIKVIDPRAAGGKEFEERFQREVQVSRRLVHRHIVKLIDYGKEEEYPYLVMEMIQGDTLRSQVVPNGLPPDRAARLIEPVMEALDFAHKLGIVHRDLKPENVMLSYDKGNEVRVVVMDFGLARSHQFQTVTATGDVLGTPSYMAPEQINGQWEAATDQYAVGVMAYEMLTGRRPFEHEEVIQILMQHLQQEPTPPREFKPTLPRALDEVVLRMLHKDPKERFPTMGDALQAWRKALIR